MKAVKVIGIGAWTPQTILSNDDLSKIVDTSDEWIYSRTGIKRRHVVSGNESTVELALNAAKDALAFAGKNSSELDCIIVATSMPDNLYPSTACEVQRELEASNAIAFDIVAACTGLIYAMSVASQYIKSGCYKNVLVIGVDIHSRFLDWTDRTTCVLFGDGAGAFLLTCDDDISKNEILSIDLKADGARSKELCIPLSGKNCPLVEPNEQKSSTVYMNGKEIYKFAVVEVPKSIETTLQMAGLSLEKLDFLIPHQANIRIIKTIADKLNLPMEKVLSNVEEYGNTSTASIPLALKEAIEQGKVGNNKILALSGFGAGLTWGTCILKWNAKDCRKG